MKEVYLLRAKSDEKQTLGALITDDGRNLFVCRTLELPDLLNQSQVSCIPAGEYLCQWTLSPRLNIYTYEVLSVPGRSGIRIHAANFFHQIQGCIALGDSVKDINIDGELDVIHSGETVKSFNALMAGNDFTLIVKWLS